MGLNNVNVESMQAFAAEVERDPNAGRKSKKVVGEWNFKDGEPQFRATMEFPAGTQVTECDFLPPMGGRGLRPDPVQYCLYGFAACFASTYAAVAAAENVPLKKLRVAIENRLDLSRALGVSDRVPIEDVVLTLEVEADAPKAKLEELRRAAEDRCPGVYCMTNPIPLTTRLGAIG
ncbi:MAG: OsmC family protein [Gemmatimonadota bacterium]